MVLVQDEDEAWDRVDVVVGSNPVNWSARNHGWSVVVRKLCWESVSGTASVGVSDHAAMTVIALCGSTVDCYIASKRSTHKSTDETFRSSQDLEEKSFDRLIYGCVVCGWNLAKPEAAMLDRYVTAKFTTLRRVQRYMAVGKKNDPVAAFWPTNGEKTVNIDILVNIGVVLIMHFLYSVSILFWSSVLRWVIIRGFGSFSEHLSGVGIIIRRTAFGILWFLWPSTTNLPYQCPFNTSKVDPFQRTVPCLDQKQSVS